MTPPARGAEALRRALAERTLDLRELDLAGFRRWLGLHLARWERDPLFAQRRVVRELRRSHPRLRDLEARLREAGAADRASDAFARLAETEGGLRGARQAVAGLSAALERAEGEERARLAAKLERFRARRDALAREHEEYTRSSPERQALLRLRRELEALRAEAGLDPAEAELERLGAERGRASTRHGAGFERLALSLTRERLLPEIAAEAPPGARIEVLVGVTLGAADVEIDQLVVRVPEDPSRPVEALAAVEAKRNPNDLAHGFRRRRADLAWLRGEGGLHDAERRRSRSFPAGLFDRPAGHRQGGETFVLAPESFARLEPPRGLCLISREGALWGVSGAALGRIAHRASTDERWDPEDEGYLESLREWCLSLTEPMEAPDVLRLYASDPQAARRVLLVGREG